MKEADFSNLKILLVEDSEINILVIKRFLDAWKVNCEVIKDGKDAIEVLDSNGIDYDFVLLDIYLPGATGFEIINILREQYEYSPEMLPVIAVTSSLEPKLKELIEKNYFQGLLSKPFTENELFTILEKYSKN